MSSLKFAVFIVTALLLHGCTLANESPLPYKTWSLGFSAPDYMEVWIETADVLDIQGQFHPHAMSGLAAMAAPPNFSGDPRGWPEDPGLGKSKRVLGADLPRSIYVRWQSLVEPQTYVVVVNIDEITRRIMRRGEKAYCTADGRWITDHRNALGIELAPGGIVKVSAIGQCISSIEVATVRAIIARHGPYGQGANGKHRPLSPVSKAYVEKFGIPYDSWK